MTYPTHTGYTCPKCGAYVSPSTYHTCWGYNTPQDPNAGLIAAIYALTGAINVLTASLRPASGLLKFADEPPTSGLPERGDSDG